MRNKLTALPTKGQPPAFTSNTYFLFSRQSLILGKETVNLYVTDKLDEVCCLFIFLFEPLSFWPLSLMSKLTRLTLSRLVINRH